MVPTDSTVSFGLVIRATLLVARAGIQEVPGKDAPIRRSSKTTILIVSAELLPTQEHLLRMAMATFLSTDGRLIL
jgi:hypothetical protein